MMKSLQVRGVEIGTGIPKISVPIVGSTAEQILAQAQAVADSPAQIAEWRVDYAPEEILQRPEEMMGQLRSILGEKLLLVTFRSKAEGGEREIRSEDYVRFCEAAVLSRQTDLLDVELSAGEDVCASIIRTAEAAGVYTVISSHFFTHTPQNEQIWDLFQKMEESGASIPKLAVMPQNRQDVLRLMQIGQEYAAKTDRPLILISMGKLAMVSRLAGELTGSCITFGTAGQASAPGQIDAVTLDKILQVLH